MNFCLPLLLIILKYPAFTHEAYTLKPAGRKSTPLTPENMDDFSYHLLQCDDKYYSKEKVEDAYKLVCNQKLLSYQDLETNNDLISVDENSFAQEYNFPKNSEMARFHNPKRHLLSAIFTPQSTYIVFKFFSGQDKHCDYLGFVYLNSDNRYEICDEFP
ncbi:BgTH12-01862 [Blumeria graminis f. sp. triticale]|uniref:BgTH12-01862 n=1 Tax=Blumeria graminis f. sp. triticale TaxID=1689686 RepID=A0A9W4D0A5_BLUGR|nr:BgTH12-01862 [Blumeria graminis f. sp. triticale]